jgi:hypothetical protein
VTKCQRCGSANFHVKSDPDPDRHQNNADLHANPSYNYVGKSVCLIFLISVKTQMCHNFQHFGQHIEISGKKLSLSTFTFAWN